LDWKSQKEQGMQSTDEKQVPPVSAAKQEANRRNAQHSTGPKTAQGKKHSRSNARKHGIFTSETVIAQGAPGEDPGEFNEILVGLDEYFQPVGYLEDLLVQKVGVCLWREKRGYLSEAGAIARQAMTIGGELDRMFAAPHPGDQRPRDYPRLPGNEIDRILRYLTSIQRELASTLNLLERLQRARKGELVPSPVAVQVTNY
jgi:hypothetical protein